MPSSIRTSLALVVLAAGLLVVGTVRAQGKASPEARAEARKHFNEGKKHHEAARYREAIAEFQLAHDLAPSPKVLFNIAQSYRLLGDKRNARAYYEQFLAQESVGQAADEARSHLEELTKAILAEEDAARLKAEEEGRRLEAERAQAEAERRRVEEERRQADEATRRRVAEDDARQRRTEEERRRLEEERRRLEASREGRGRPPSALRAALRWGGLGVAAVGGIVLGYGVYQATEARRIESDLEDFVQANEMFPDDVVARFESGNRAESRFLFGTIVGSLAVIGGGVCFYLGGRIEVEPAASPGAVGAGLRGSF
jgi:hypothetical protein